MARQSGAVSLKGRLGELSFYHHKHYGYLVRRKGGASKERVAKDPNFARTRENASEFGQAASAGKLIRRALQAATGLKGDTKAAQGLMSLLVKLGKTDMNNVRGKRSPAAVFGEVSSREVLKRFPFYRDHPLEAVFGGPISCDTESGQIVLGCIAPGGLLSSPAAATHVEIRAAVVRLDFDSGSYTVFQAAPLRIPLGEVPDENLVLNCAPESGTAGFPIGVAAVVFLQEQNGRDYVLQEGMSLGMV